MKVSERRQKREGRKPRQAAALLFAAVLLFSQFHASHATAAASKYSEIPGVTQADAAAPASPVAAAGTNSAPTNSAVNVMETLDDKHKLAIGDRLSFRVEEDQEDPKGLMVTDLGDVEVPYLGRFPAENKTCRQLAAELKAALEKDYYFRATVVIAVDAMVKTRGKVYLVGPVRVPGPVEIPSDETLTLSKAILRAGGFTDFADRRHVQVTRKSAGASDKQSFVVDVAQIFDKGKIEKDLVLEPGDLVFVPERAIRF